MTIIGVTGHRYLDESQKLIRSIDKALKLIETHYAPPFIVLSSLAEGADRLVPYRAFALWEAARLIVSLPLDVEEYMEDFNKLSSKADFINLMQLADEILQPPQIINRADAYQAAGNRVIDLCDVLIAIWDGAEAQGKGGTAEIVALAREREMPLIWIHAGNRIPGTETPVSLGKEQGKISLENFTTE
jgi:hypothetical protein